MLLYNKYLKASVSIYMLYVIISFFLHAFPPFGKYDQISALSLSIAMSYICHFCDFSNSLLGRWI